MKYHQGEKLSISLPVKHAAALRELAVTEPRCSGRISRAVAYLIETNPVTKALLASPARTT
jgi:hypothetical protein